ncbi:glycoside hydrolase family 42 [Sphingorhabdus lutea]|uniref:Glycoside hydrolase family 42 n=2 Tax=Sphingorhabdus lutea TaxID=1913578 RepID=A0A1L3JA85_9SPHN|nr:glycoside hydrolase family 42 [Sphingorhabdus lutea]
MMVLAALPLSACASSTNIGLNETHAASEMEQARGDKDTQITLTTGALEAKARAKIVQLEMLMEQARAQNIDVTREETTIWFANEFLKFANWDENNQAAVEYAFSQYRYWADESKERAAAVPDFQRKEVHNILDKSIAEMRQILSGEVQRRPVNKVDWQNITVADNKILSGGRPIFLYDYFSKSVGRPLTDKDVYNDHLGAIYHGGQRLYDVDHDRAINSFLMNEDGSWNEERLGYLTEIPDTNVGFLYFWNMGIPKWVEQREPEVRKGRSLFTGYDIDNPLVRDLWGKIIRKTGAMTKGKKVTQLGFVMANEPHWFSEKGHWTAPFQEMQEISSYTRAKFRLWLKNKYSANIGQLNKNWGTNFKSFDKVEIIVPISRETRGKPIWYDWSRFNMDRSIDWFSYIQGELHKVNPDAHTSIKIMPNMFTENARSHGIDYEALTELTTMIGSDAKATEGRLLRETEPQNWESKYSYFWEELSLSYDFMNSVSPEKIHFDSESHFLSASGFRKMDMTPEYVRNVYWLATLQGMDVNTGWFWARDPDGSFEDRLEGTLNFFDPALAGSFVGSVNQQPQVANAVTQIMYDMNSFSEEILALREQRRPIRLFYSETSAINKPYHMTEAFEAYESLFFEGFPVGFATQKIIEKQDNRNWDVIAIYKTQYVTDAEFVALQAYLNGGGTIIMDNMSSLSMNEYGVARTAKLNASKGKIIILNGINDLGAFKASLLKEAAQGRPDIILSEDNGTAHKGVTWRAVKQSDGSYLVNALNIGINAAKLSLKKRDGSLLNATDMMTGKKLGASFEIARNGILLLHVEQK